MYLGTGILRRLILESSWDSFEIDLATRNQGRFPPNESSIYDLLMNPFVEKCGHLTFLLSNPQSIFPNETSMKNIPNESSMSQIVLRQKTIVDREPKKITVCLGEN